MKFQLPGSWEGGVCEEQTQKIRKTCKNIVMKSYEVGRGRGVNEVGKLKTPKSTFKTPTKFTFEISTS